MIDLAQPLLVYGAGRFGQALCRAIWQSGGTVVGFVVSSVDTATPGRILGMPVRSIFDIPTQWRGLQLLCGIFNRGIPLSSLAANATAAGFKELVMPWALAERFGDLLGWRYWLASPSRLASASSRISEVMRGLADSESRRTVEAIRSFWMGEDLAFSEYRSSEAQYFNPLTLGRGKPRSMVYVDCGAYTGDTFMAFQAASPCASAYLFEPDPVNFRGLVRSVEGLPVAVHCFPLAVSDEHRLVAFSGGDGEACAVSESGADQVLVTPLDDILTTVNIDFLKIDIEGADLRALRGAKRLIARSRPAIAISLYHNPDDLWEIPLAAFELCEDYDFFVRQHFFNSFDSVLYATPRDAHTGSRDAGVGRGW